MVPSETAGVSGMLYSLSSYSYGTQVARIGQVELASATIELEVGQQRDVRLELDDPPEKPRLTSLAGSLTSPAFPGRDAAVLRVFDSARYQQGKADHEIKLADMQPTFDDRTWHWSFEVAPGRYQLKLWPLLTSVIVDVPESGLSGVDLAFPRIAEVAVVTVDATTRKRVPIEKLSWGVREHLEGQVNHLSLYVDAEEEPGRFRFHTVPGPVRLWASTIPDGLDYGAASGTWDVVAGPNELELELAPVCGIRIVLRDGDATLPNSDDIYPKVTGTIRSVDGVGRMTYNKIRTDGYVELSAPGSYTLRLDETEVYRATSEQIVRVPAGEIVEVTLRLVRK